MFEQTYVYVLIGVALLIVFILLFYAFKPKRKPVVDAFDAKQMLTLFQVDNVLSIDYKRDKIHIKVRHPETIDFNALKDLDVTGVNVVGDIVKFYFSDRNQERYETIKETYESQVKS